MFYDYDDRYNPFVTRTLSTRSLVNLFTPFNTLKNAGNSLKNHDIISSKTPTDKGKNTCKKQVCNQQ
ncbi:hypothetical protein JCM17724A_25130 [Prevotella fusca JCM 17724]